MMHYTFYNNEVTSHVNWLTVLNAPRGAFFYSPGDRSDTWGVLIDGDRASWLSQPVEKMPKEFRTQLLLMGVPC